MSRKNRSLFEWSQQVLTDLGAVQEGQRFLLENAAAYPAAAAQFERSHRPNKEAIAANIRAFGTRISALAESAPDRVEIALEVHQIRDLLRDLLESGTSLHVDLAPRIKIVS